MPEDLSIFDVKSHEVLPKMYLSYALSVIKDRSLPDIRDGLKPVARRILFSMNEMGVTSSKPTRKSARIVGDVLGKYHPHGDGCWRGDTDVLALNGKIYKFKDLLEKELWILAYDKETNKPVPAIAHSFRITKNVNELYRITFWNGEIAELTGNHELCTLSGKWSRTDKLKIGNIIVNGIVTNNEYPKFRSSNDFMSIGKKVHHIVGENIYGDAEIYHHKNKNTKNNAPDNLDPITKTAHEKIHKNYEKGLRKGNETMFHSTDEFREATRKKNSEIIKAVNQKHYLFKAIKIIKLIISDKLEPTKELYCKYRTKIYNGTTIERLVANGHTFEEVVEYAKSKEKIKLIDTSKAKGHTVGLKIENDDTCENNRSNDSRKKGHLLYTASIIVKECLEDYGLDFTIDDYDDVRCDICEMNDNNFYPKFKTLTKWFNITSINQLLDSLSQRHLMIIKNIEVFKVVDEPVYDFTVDKYENMYLPVGTNEKGETKLILTHNSIYGAAARMVQNFTTRYPLIIGQGNFGSIEDKPAAMRYTEMKMSKISDEVLADIDNETVDFMSNFDGTLQEPKVLPTKVPLFLLNGSVGIAVGMATSVPPHNLTEVIDALLAYIEGDEDITIEELMRYIKGPDFPSGALMFDQDIQKIYETGRGSVTLRAKAEIENDGKKSSIIITELPYQLDKAKLLTRIAALYQSKDKIEGIDGIADIRDESEADVRLVIELRKGVQPQVVLNTLYRRTELQSKHAIFMRALINNEPKMVNLLDIFNNFIEHRKNVIIRRAEYELKKSETKMHLLEGYLIVFNNLDNILNDVKISTSTKDAYKKLKKYKLSERQIKSILDLRVQRIAQFERDSIVIDHDTLKDRIIELKTLLNSEQIVLDTVKEELNDIKHKYGDERRTTLIKAVGADEDTVLDEVQEEEVVITVTKNGLVKRTPVSEYRVQRIRGRGLIGVDIKEDDYVTKVFQMSTHDFALVFTNKGLCYRMNIYDIPSFGRTAAGKSILNILSLDDNEKIASVIPVSETVGKVFLLATEKGQIKKLNVDKLQRPRAGGTKAIGIDEQDQLIDVKLIEGDSEIILVTTKGKSIRFNTEVVRETGKSGSGVRGIRLLEDDKILFVNVIEDDESSLMTVTRRGYAKRTKLGKFRAQRRGGQGVVSMNACKLTGDVVSANIVKDNEEQMIIVTSQGMLIRIKVERIRELGRHTQGSKIQKLKSGDEIASIAYLGVVEDVEVE